MFGKVSLPLCALLVLSGIEGCVRLGIAQKSTPTAAYPSSALSKTEAHTLLESGKFAELNARLSAVQADYRNGRISDEQLYSAFHVLYDADDALRSKYDAWVTAYPRSYVALLARGIYHRKVGQASRGGAYLDATSDEQLRGMDAEYDLAMRDLEASKALEQRPLLTLSNEMDIASHYGDQRSLRKILDQSLAIDPQNIVVRELYMTYLEPRWGGGQEQMQAFLAESRKAGLSERKLGLLEAVILSDRAHSSEERQDYAAAERDDRKAIELGADDCLSCLSSVLIHEGKFADDIPILTQLIAADPSDVDDRVWRGQAYWSIGKNKEAFADLLAAAQLGNAYAQTRVAIFYMQGVPGVVVRDPAAGLQWFRKCAAQGDQACRLDVQIALKHQ